MITRRTMVTALAASALTPLAAQAWPRRGTYPPNTGAAQANVWIPQLGLEYPCIDVMKMCNRVWENSAATEDYLELIQSNGYPSAMASGGGTYRTYTTGYLTASTDRWVITWIGDGTIDTNLAATDGISASRTLNVANRMEYQVTSSVWPVGTDFSIIIQILTIPTSISAIKIFRKSQESLLASGEKFNPDWLSLYTGLGRIRYMDLMDTNLVPISNWSQRTPETAISWIGFNVYADLYCGTSVRTGNDYVAPHGPASGNNASWTDGQMVQAVIPSAFVYTAIVTFANGATPNVRADSHGLSTGNKVFFFQTSGSSLSSSATFSNQTIGRFFTITVVNANNFTLDGVDSTTWGSCTGYVAKQVTFQAGLLPAKPVVDAALGSIDPVILLVGAQGKGWNLIYNADFDVLQWSIFSGDFGQPNGFPPEVLVDMANRLNVNPWFCVPTAATTDYDLGLANLIKTRLRRPLKAVVEYSNEMWNIAPLLPTGYGISQAGQRWSVLGTDSYNTWYGYRFSQMADNFESVFTGGDRDFLELSFGVFTANRFLSLNQARFEAPAASLPAFPISKCDSISIAPYLESSRSNTSNAQYVWGYKQGGAPATAALAWLDMKLRTDDRATFTGSITGSVLTVTAMISGTISLSAVVAFPGASAFLTIASFGTGTGGTGTYNLNRSDPTGSQTMTAESESFTLEFCTGTLFPEWKAIADAPASGVSAKKLTMYEGGWGYIPSVLPLTATSYNGEALLQTAIAISGAANNGSGAIRLTIASTATLVDGQQYWIEKVLGTSEANGKWEVDVIDGTHIDLVGSTFANAYVGRGEVASDRDRFYVGYYNSALYAVLLSDYLDGFVADGGEYPSQYTLVGAWSQNTMWGIIQPTMYGDRNAAYTAFRSFNLT